MHVAKFFKYWFQTQNSEKGVTGFRFKNKKKNQGETIPYWSEIVIQKEEEKDKKKNTHVQNRLSFIKFGKHHEKFS